jgi:prevent-host-death family protein
MHLANLTDAKNRLSELVERARAGEHIRILVRGQPAADLGPVSGVPASAPNAEDGVVGFSAADEAHVSDLERRGLVRRGTGMIPAELWQPGPRPTGKPASELLIAERRESV